MQQGRSKHMTDFLNKATTKNHAVVPIDQLRSHLAELDGAEAPGVVSSPHAKVVPVASEGALVAQKGAPGKPQGGIAPSKGLY
jgi:hypothetical protein